MMHAQPQLLIIDDDRERSGLMARVLRDEGYRVAIAARASHALALPERQQPDLIVLNPLLSESDGFDLCRRLRQQSDVPIIAIMPGQDRTDAAVAIALGAEACLRVPFSAEELLRHVRAGLATEGQAQYHRHPLAIMIDGLMIDSAARRVERDGQAVALSSDEWAILDLLARNAGRVVSCDALIAQMAGGAGDRSNEHLRACIDQLRAKVADDPAAPQMILTIDHHGYALTGRCRSRGGADDPAKAEHRPAPRPAKLSSIPGQMTSFVGREAEVASLHALLRSPEIRLVTLRGCGGSGKTRLAQQASAGLADAFEHGISFVSLAPVRDPDLVASSIAQALGIKEPRRASLVEVLKGYLRTRQMLLILDSFEHLRDAAPLIGEILAAAPRLKVLATSRAPLQISGEREFCVPPLPLPDPGQLPPPEALAQTPAVALFIDRAQATQPSFTLTTENAAAIAGVCRSLDGLPLAIELAAARCNVLSPQAILDRLDSRLRLLTSGSKDLPQRHQTLRATIDWSYHLLDPAQKRLFARLAAFRGSWALEAAEAVCSADTPPDGGLLDIMESLLNHSLIQREQSEGLEYHFLMLETVREYALEQLAASGELEQIQRHHAAYYLAFAEKAAQELPRNQGLVWAVRLERAHDNVRAALQWSLREGDAAVQMRFAAAMWKFWHTRSYHTEGGRYLTAALAHPSQPASPLRVQVCYGAGWLAFDQGNYAQAAHSFAAGLELAQRCGDRYGAALTLQGIGELAQARGDFADAWRCFEDSREIMRALGDREEIAWSIDHLGRVAQEQGDPVTAQALYAESLALFRELRHNWGIIVSLFHLGGLLRQQARLEQAQGFLEECLRLSRNVGETRNHIAALATNYLGEIALRRGSLARAQELAQDALTVSREILNAAATAQCLENLGRIATAQGRADAASAYFRERLALQQG